MDYAGLEECIQTYGKDLYSFCRQLTNSRTEAEDLYQDTFLRVIELERGIDTAGNPKSYLLSIAVRIWKNKKRKYAWRRRILGTEVSAEEIVPEPSSEAETVEDQIISGEERQMVQNEVNQLPDRLRIPVVLYYMEQLKLSEIADVLQIPEGTVKSRLHKAKRILKKKLEVVLNEERD